MQSISNNPLVQAVSQFTPNPTQEDLSSIAQKVMRFKIVADRYTRGFERAERKGPPGAFTTHGIFQTTDYDRARKIKANSQGKHQVNDRSDGDYTHETFTNREPTTYPKDTITIIDIDFIDKHTSTRGYKKLTLPFVPRELSYEPSSKFVGIATMGRNTPFYQFTGSEDSLQFEIDWFSSQEDRRDVINSCRWVEALSKSNGYEEPPHRVSLQWGSDDLLFSGDIWIVTEATYSLTDFVNAYRNKQGEIVKVGMLPQQAIQRVTLKRLSNNNMLTSEIMGKLANNEGYGN